MALQSIQHLVTDKITAQAINERFPHDTWIEHPDDGGRIYALGRSSERAVTAWVNSQKPATPALATDKQVNFIMRLIGQGRAEQGCWYTGPTTREGVAKMDRKSASTYIEALLEA